MLESAVSCPPESRFAEPQHPAFRAIHFSIDFDRRLWPQDLRRVARRTRDARRAAASSPRPSATSCCAASTSSRRELAGGTFPFAADDEDIHLAIERRLTELVGPVGGKLHTARSRNDQVATDMALFVRDEAARRDRARSRRWRGALVDAAAGHLDWPLPGYTHLQRAQPVYLAHHLLAYVWMLLRDRDRFAFVVSRLGRRAAAGRRRAGRRELRHRPPDGRRASWASPAWRPTRSTRSPTATSSSTTWARRRPALTHLSRLGAELVLWSS